MRRILHAAFAFLIAGAAAAPLKAAPISTDQWYTFGFDGVGSSLSSGLGFILGTNPPSLAAPDPAWTFTNAAPVQLVVSDGFASGDQFSFFDFGVLIGTTSASTSGDQCNEDITACLADDSFSHGSFLLGPGNHSITGEQISGITGAGFFQIASTTVPEPMSLGLFGAGIAGLAFMRRKRRRA